jgi:hypothetical protein
MKDDQIFALSAEEGRRSWAKVAIWGGWVALLALILATGVHAIYLVESQLTATAGVMGVIRLISPVLTEAIVAIVSIGFAAHVWRANQRLVGLAIEILWILFAGLNLITAFNMESAGTTLPPALFYWLHYGLPISALAAGALFYTMLRLDPEHQRQTEMQATGEAHKMAEFAAKRSVLLSPQMASVLRQRGWLAVIEGLEREGYTADQIRFMLSGVPELQALTPGTTLPPVQPTQPAPPPAGNQSTPAGPFSMADMNRAYHALVDRFTHRGWHVVTPPDVCDEFGLDDDGARDVIEAASRAVFGRQPQPNGSSPNGGNNNGHRPI